MSHAVATAAANMAAAYDTDVLARGMILGVDATIRELTRRGLLPEKEQAEQEEQQ